MKTTIKHLSETIARAALRLLVMLSPLLPVTASAAGRGYNMGGVDGLTQATPTTPASGKRAIMWIDYSDWRTFTSVDSVELYLNKLHGMGFTDIVVDLKPITGEVLFHSKHAPLLREWQEGREPDFDYLGTFISVAHRLGMTVHASLNTFAGGNNYADRGRIYSDHPEWASWVYLPDGIRPITTKKSNYDGMIDPMNMDYRRVFKELLRDLVSQYPELDGVVLDRCRYDGIDADFSPATRKLFEKHIGHGIEHWPDDIFHWGKDAKGTWQIYSGPLFKEWLLWRAQNIYDAMKEFRDVVKGVRPSCSFGTYSGAWYPSYYEVGVNFASQTYDPSKEKDFQWWVSPGYGKTGYMELLDFYMAGNYYNDVTIAERRKHNKAVRNETDSRSWTGDWYSVEGSCRHLRQILGGHKFYGGMLISQLYKTPEKIAEQIEMNIRESDGLMMFAIGHLVSHPQLWKEVEKGMKSAKMNK